MSDGAVLVSSIRLASCVIAVHCLSNALSKAILANFFSVGAHVSSSLYCAMDFIDDQPFCFIISCLGQPNINPLKFPLQRLSDSFCFWDGVAVCLVTPTELREPRASALRELL